jgi:hypothetical protein
MRKISNIINSFPLITLTWVMRGKMFCPSHQGGDNSSNSSRPSVPF